MAEIKSALEIALEKTAGIEGDKETLKANEYKNDGKRLASRFLSDNEEKVDVSGELKSRADAEGRNVKEGFLHTILANLSLPTDDTYPGRIKKLEEGVHHVVKDKKSVSHLFQQIDQFFKQYLQTRDQVGEQLKQQYEPQLREKERQLAKQMGSQIRLTAESDPEYMNLLHKNLARLEEQYSQALVQVKDELTGLFNSRR